MPMVLPKCLWLLPDVWGSYQMSRVLTKCLGLSPEWVDSTQEPPEDAVDERVVFDPNCLQFDHEKGDIWQKIIAMWQLFLKLAVSSVVVWFMENFISPHDSRQNRNVFNYKHCQRHYGPRRWQLQPVILVWFGGYFGNGCIGQNQFFFRK